MDPFHIWPVVAEPHMGPLAFALGQGKVALEVYPDLIGDKGGFIGGVEMSVLVERLEGRLLDREIGKRESFASHSCHAWIVTPERKNINE